MATRKVLVIGQEDVSDAETHIRFRHWMRALLRRMGFRVDISVIFEKTASNASPISREGYEFAVIVHPFSYNPDDSSWLKNLTTGLTVPCFIVNHAEAGAWTTSFIGTTRNQTADWRLCTVQGLGELPMYCTTHTDANTVGYDITPLAWETATSTNLVMWKMTSGTYNVYGSAEGGTNSPLECWFPILMQFAINDGQISAPPKRAMAALDIDDLPDDDGSAPTTAAEMESIVNDLNAGKMVATIGVPASKTVGSRNELVSVWDPAGVVDVIVENQVSKGGPLYPIEHMGSTFWSTVEISGNPSGGQTKSAIDTFYRDHIDNMHDHGILQGNNANGLDSYGYHFFNTNRVNDKALQLATPLTTKLADPLETTAMAGYGWKVVRLDSNTNARVVSVLSDTASRPINDYFGILIVDSTSPFDATTENAALASNVQTYAQSICQGYLTGSAIRGDPLYMHGVNGVDYNNASKNPPLRIVLQKIALINNFCKDTLRCGHPSEYA